MDNKKEYIVCAAIQRIETNPCPKVTKATDIYEVELGMSHADILHRFENVVKKSPSAQGFFTSFRRFVDRSEAYKLAVACGQIQDNYGICILYSEDIY